MFYFLALIVSFGLVVSCDKTTETEDEMEVQTTPDLETIISDNLAGNYTGELVITVDEQETDPITQEVTVEKGEGESITLSITDFNMDGTPLGDIVLENYAVSDNENGTYSFTGESTLTLLDGALEAEISATGSFNLSETVSLSLKLDIDAYEGAIVVTVTYDGTKE